MVRGNRQNCVSYYKRDDSDFVCLVDSIAEPSAERLTNFEMLSSGGTLSTYRLAMAATGEYTDFHGGTIVDGMAGITTAMNRVNGIYEVELAVRMVLVANNDMLVYTNSSTDPYTNSDGTTMLGQNQSNVDSVIGSANYDIGHVFSTGGEGIAGLGVVCLSNNKARGVTGLSSPTGDPFYVDFVAHEIGHQFNANHTFNGENNNCSGANRNGSTAYEPGSGSTIMAYAGICGIDDLQSNSDAYFHFISYEEIQNFITSGSGSSCRVTSATGNNPPMVDAGPSYTIPHTTPFALTPASWSDPDGHALTFSWEEADLGTAQTVSEPDNGSSPIFRFFPPTSDPTRTFPRLSDLVNNTTVTSEQLPTTNRTLNFRVTVRDNQPSGGGVNSDDTQVFVATAVGPFAVQAPNSGGTFSGPLTVDWFVGGTTGPPVNTANVRVLLSTDGGLTWPTVLSSSTPNDGSEIVNLPNLVSSTACVRVEAVGNIFFDICDTDFNIEPAPDSVFFSAGPGTAVNDTAGNGNSNGVADPGESYLQLTLPLQNTGTLDANSVTAELSSLTPSVSVLATGADYPNVLSRQTESNEWPFVIAVDAAHACGATIDLRLTVTSDDGGNTVDYTLSGGIGGSMILFSDNFESGTSNWTLSGFWHLQASSVCTTPLLGYQSPTNAMVYNQLGSCDYKVSGNPNGPGNSGNVTMNVDVAIPALAAVAELSWFDTVQTENAANVDIYSVDISTDGGSNWTALFADSLTDEGWNQEFVNLLPYAGQNVRVRFNFDTINNSDNAYYGWYVDDVAISTTLACDAPTTGCSSTCGDIDGRGGNTNLFDFAEFTACFASQPTQDANCLCANLYEFGDDIIDLNDLAVFTLLYLDTSANTPPHCP